VTKAPAASAAPAAPADLSFDTPARVPAPGPLNGSAGDGAPAWLKRNGHAAPSIAERVEPARRAGPNPFNVDGARDRRARPNPWDLLSSDQQEAILHAGTHWRDGLTASLEVAGYSDAESYLDAVGAVTAELDRRATATAGGGIDAVDLLALDLPPLRWIVPELLPEGTSVVASPPKVGKSCLVYQVVVEVAIGGELLGRRVAPGSALYLALEDGRRRGQARLRAALAGRTMPRGRLEVRWEARKIGEGLEDDIAEWLDGHPDAVVVAIDTLGRVRPRTNGKRNAYEVDVEDLGRLQGLFRDRRVALIIVHHARKDAGGDDFLASVSGTYGLTGSADTIVVLRRKRLEAFGTIVVTGRDVADAEVPVRFDGMTWQSAPASLPEASFERSEVYRAIEEHGPIFPAAIAGRIGLERTSVQHMVSKLVETGAVARGPKGYVATTALALARATTNPSHSDNSGSEWSDEGHARANGASVADEMVGIFAPPPEDLDIVDPDVDEPVNLVSPFGRDHPVVSALGGIA
jgi:hypothetical protein